MGKILDYTIVRVDGQDVRIGKKGERVITIDLALNDAEYYAVVKNFSNKNSSWKTCSYTKIFQNQLAGFKQKSAAHPHLRDHGVGILADHLNTISEHYATLEALINNAPKGMSVDPISVLLKTLDTFEIELSTALDALKDAVLKAKLLKSIADFKKAAAELQTKTNPPATQKDIRRLFCMQPEDPNIPSLGKLVGTHMMALSKYGMNKTYELTDQNPNHKIANRFEQSILMHELTKHLSDAAAYIEIKGFALYGARYNNMRQPVPQSMLNSIRPPKTGLSEEKQWTNIRPYISSTDNIAMLQQVVDFVKNREKEEDLHSKTAQWIANLKTAAVIFGTFLAIPFVTVYAAIKIFAINEKSDIEAKARLRRYKKSRIMDNIRAYRIFIENIKELALFVPIRGGLSITAGLLHLALMPVIGSLSVLREIFWNAPSARYQGQSFHEYLNDAINRISNSFAWLQKGFKTFDKFFSDTHQKFSPVIAAKKEHNKHLENVDEEFKNKLNNPVSYYDVGLSYISSAKVTDLVFKGVSNLGNGFLGFRDTILDFITNKLDRETVAEKYIKEMDVDIVAIVKKGLEDLSEKKESEGHNPVDESVVQVELEEDLPAETDPTKFRTRAEEEEWAMNHMSSPLDFFDDIAYGLAQFVIDPMFRKSPAAATLFFAFANLSFGAMTVPGLFGAGANQALTTFPKLLAKLMMGKEAGAHAGMMNNLIAAFVEWKVPFFTFEAMVELNHNPDFLDEFLNNSEKITTMVTIGIALGWAIHFLPPIPNNIDISFGHQADLAKIPGAEAYTKFANTSIHYYFAAVNVFIHESKEVTEFGLPPLTGLEYAFLAVKATLLFESLVTGGHKAHNPKIKDFLMPNQNNKYETLQKITHTMRKLIAELVANGELADKLTLSQIVDQKGEVWVKQRIILPAIMVQKGYNNGVEKYKLEVADYLFESLQAGFEEAKAFNNKTKETRQELKQNALKAKAIAKVNQTLDEVMEQVDIDPAIKDMHEKRNSMITLIQMVQKMDLHGKKFKNTAQANDVYNELYDAIKNYNNAQRNCGNWDQQFDKEQFLHSFYNKHIYKGSNNFTRLASFIPFAPITLSWRAVQYVFGSQALKYKVKKSFAKDYAILLQFFSFMARPGVIATRSYSYLTLAILALALPYALTRLISWPQQIQRYFSPKNDYSQNPTAGDKIFNACIDFARKPEPYAYWSKFTAALIAAPLAPFPGAFMRAYRWLSADRGAAKYAEKIRIADTNETLKEDIVDALNQLNASKAYDAAKYVDNKAEPTEEQNIDVLVDQEQTKQVLEIAFENVKNRAVEHDKTHQSLFRKIRHENKRRAEKATLVAYSKELRILENRFKLTFDLLNNRDVRFDTLRQQFSELKTSTFSLLSEPATNVELMAVSRNHIHEKIVELEKLQAEYQKIVKLNDQPHVVINTDDINTVDAINASIINIIDDEYKKIIVEEPAKAEVINNNRRKYEKEMLEVALKLGTRNEKLKYVVYVVNSLEDYPGKTELSKQAVLTLKQKIDYEFTSIKAEIDECAKKSRPEVGQAIVSNLAPHLQKSGSKEVLIEMKSTRNWFSIKKKF